METNVKKREWVKNAAIILLAGLLVLTFFSNTIMNRNLPEVAAQSVTGGSINAKVRGTGTVTANGNHLVKAEDTREIRAVMVKAGQNVEAGDLLFVLGSGESSELEDAQEKLYQLQLSYQRTALGGSYNDYSADEVRLQAALDAYDAAADKVSEFENMDHSDIVTRLLREKEKKQNTIDENNKKADDLRNEINDKQRELTAKQVELDAYRSAYDDLVNQSQTTLTEKEAARLSARRDVVEYYELNAPEKMPEDNELDDPVEKNDVIQKDPASTEREKEVWQALTDAHKEALKAKDDLQNLSRGTMDEAQAAVDLLQGEIDEKTETIAELEQTNESLRAEIDQIQEEIDDHMSDTPNAAAYRAALEEKANAYLNYLDLKAALDARKNADARSNASIGLDLQDLNRQIEEQKKKIEELSGGEENQVLAKVSGTVQSVECTAGDTVAKDGVLCIIEVPDMGYTLSFSVTSDQAARLRVGDSAAITNYYWGREIIATLANIRVDPKNPQTNKLLTFDVSGDVSAGAELTVSVGQRSASYDVVVPKSALHNDTNGDFVYKVESKSSPLGNRYVARRVSVEVLGMDDNLVALSGDLGWGDYVITTSSAPIRNGDLVRLAD